MVFLRFSNIAKIVNEKLLVKENSSSPYVEKDLYVLENNDNLLKTYGESKILKEQKIKGFISGSEATIFDISEYKLRSDIDYSSNQDMGWSSDVGFLNSDHQVLPDNDYYQNLSYAPSNMSIPYRHRVSAYRIKWRFAFSPNEIEIFVPRMRSPKMQP